MKIYVGSTNPSKSEAVKLALMKLGITEAEIVPFDAWPCVGTKPTDREIELGARSRNYDMWKSLKDYDYLISMEGGIEHTYGSYYLVTYVSVFTPEGISSEGKSIGIPVTKRIYEYYKNGNSINKLIEQILNETDYKKKMGISGYLSDGIFKRSTIDSDAVAAALLPFFVKEKVDKLEEQILKLENK